MSTNREKVAIYIMAVKKSQKRIEEEKRALMQYCLCNDYDVVQIFLETKIGSDIDYSNQYYKKHCRKSLEEMLRKRTFSKIVVMRLDAFGSKTVDIWPNLNSINGKGKNIEVVINKKSLNIYINDLIRGLKINFGRLFDYKNRLRYLRPNCECKMNTSYYYRERGNK